MVDLLIVVEFIAHSRVVLSRAKLRFNDPYPGE
jgi:hypothetical protein